jgi:hypothetical protein
VTKTAFKHICNPPPAIKIAQHDVDVQCGVSSQQLDAYCDIGAAYLDSAIGVYTQLNDELKE